MKPEEIKNRLSQIENEIGDDESAHSMEKQLWEDVLDAIAKGSENPSELARLALLTRGMKFNRWYA